ncbi:MAG: CaiB/BaiF CoA-transferase family protein [Burkholderiales bacterium]
MGPLSDVKVIELGQLIAGPFCTRILAEFGAQVIKIESPDGGDPLRQWRKLHKGTSLWWYLQSRNKKSVTVNLKSEEGQEIVRRLIGEADILVENFRPGTLEKWGLGWEQLSLHNPGLVMVRLSGYGQDGPYAQRAGFGAIGALMALRHREVNDGRGQVIDVALYESVFSLMESLLPEFDVAGFVRERSGASLPGIVPSNTYTTRDGKYVVIGANGDSIFRRMMDAIGRPDLAQDPALAKNDGRVERTEELDKVIGDWCAANDLEQVLRVLSEAQVPAGKIYDAADITRDLQYLARGMIQEARLPDGTPMKVPGIVPKLSNTPGGTQWLGPAHGEHTDEVLQALGYDAEQIGALRERKVI